MVVPPSTASGPWMPSSRCGRLAKERRFSRPAMLKLTSASSLTVVGVLHDADVKDVKAAYCRTVKVAVPLIASRSGR